LRCVTVSLAVLVLLALGCLGAQAAPIVVSSNPLWTDAGVLTNTVVISGATGSWTWGSTYDQYGNLIGGYYFGPEGDPVGDSFLYDEWITNHMHGQLIGFVTTGSENMNDWPVRAVLQDDPRLFSIGTGCVTVGEAGSHLWLGFNDDYGGNYIEDNYGSVTVDVSPVPEPGTLALLGFGAVGLLPLWRRRRH